jgi:hypothetical protein
MFSLTRHFIRPGNSGACLPGKDDKFVQFRDKSRLVEIAMMLGGNILKRGNKDLIILPTFNKNLTTACAVWHGRPTSGRA